MMSDAEKLTEVIKALNGKVSKDPDKECLKACAAIKQGEIYSAQTQAAVAELTKIMDGIKVKRAFLQ